MSENILIMGKQMCEGYSMLGGSAGNLAVLTPVAIISAVALFFLFNLFFKWLWNITMPDIFGLKEINFWQAFRLLIIASVLLGGTAIIH